jgi:hypothetical protein
LESQPLRLTALFAKEMEPSGLGIVFSALRHMGSKPLR